MNRDKAKHAIYMRSWRKDHSESVALSRSKWRKTDGYNTRRSRRVRALRPDRQKAYNAVYKALKAGRLIRPDQCERCNKDCKPEAHHPDYAKRLEVNWLCVQCHRLVDSWKSAWQVKYLL